MASGLVNHYRVLCKVNSDSAIPGVHVAIEGNSKIFRTFIFSRETVRAGGLVIGRV